MTETPDTTKNELSLTEAPFTWNTLVALSALPSMPARWQNKPMEMFRAVLKGNDLGVPPSAALEMFYPVNGVLAMEGQLMAALVFRAGHVIKVKIETKGATATAFRRDPVTRTLEEVGSFTFSDADAKLAKLDAKETYKSYPKLMWSWRAISAVCRMYFPDVLMGVGYIPEEMNLSDSVASIPESIEVDYTNEAGAVEQAAIVVTEELDAEVTMEVDNE